MSLGILASDLDGTLIPYQVDEEQRQALAHVRHSFAKSRPAPARPYLAYVTGRRFPLALDGIRQWRLPDPDCLVCDVGTAIYWRHDDAFLLDQDFVAALAAQWPGAEAIHDLLAGLAGIRPQEPECQARFKCSYYCAPEALTQAQELIQQRLQAVPVAATVVASVDPHRRLGLVDVLPQAAAKERAIRHLTRRLGIEDYRRVVYAGDSGNDLDVFTSGCRAIAVANTDDATRAALQRWLTATPTAGDTLYLARRPYTAGVLEGCRHWGLLGEEG